MLFAGRMVNDCWEGYGRLKLNTGDVYEGSFKNGVRNGRGLMRYASGDVYRGNFQTGLRHGKGTRIIQTINALMLSRHFPYSFLHANLVCFAILSS
jgi:hypothetical protein